MWKMLLPNTRESQICRTSHASDTSFNLDSLLVLDAGGRDEHIGVSFVQLCAAVLRLREYLSPEFNKFIIALCVN